MEAREFYKKRLKEDPTIGNIQLMEDFAKHVIEINFCDGSPVDTNDLTIGQIKKINQNINHCVDWVNSSRDT